MKTPVSKEVYSLINAAICAPSGDNCQPWRFHLNENAIFMSYDPDTDTSFFNVDQLASVFSCGCAVENMLHRGASNDLGLEIIPFPYGQQSLTTCLVKPFKESQAESNRFLFGDSVAKRATNRLFYEKRGIPLYVKENLTGSAFLSDGIKIRLLDDRRLLIRIAKIVFMADRLRTERKDLHCHLMDMIRWNEEEATRRKDGLPLKNLEAGLMGELFLKATRNWKVMSLANSLGMSRIVAFHAMRGILSSAAVGLITADHLDKRRFFDAGRVFERVWLYLTSEGIALQPMTAITFFIVRWLHEGLSSFSQKHQKILKKIRPVFDKIFEMVPGEIPVILFRMGYAPPPSVRTPRKLVEDFIVPASS